MNQQAILQEIGYCQLVVQAYEAYLKRTIFLDDSKGELAIQASMGASLVRTQNHAIVVQNSMDKYARNKKSLSNPAEFFASLTNDPDFKFDRKPDYPTAKEKWADDTEAIANSVGQPDYVAPYAANERPQEENDFGKWVGDHIGTGFESTTSHLGGLLDGEIHADEVRDWIEECIPCAQRWRDLANLRPLDELMKILDNDLANRLNFLDGILDLLNGTEIQNQICSLAGFLNFLCIPDLAAIYAVLMALLAKILDLLNLSLAGAIWLLISAILYPFIQGLNDFIRHLLDVLLAPIVCIIDAILAQMQKIPGLKDEVLAMTMQKELAVQQLKHKAQRYIQTQDNPPSSMDPSRPGVVKSPQDQGWGQQPWAENYPPDKGSGTQFVQAWGVLDYLNSALGYLSYYISLGYKWLNDFVLQLENIIKEFLGGDLLALGEALNIAQNMQRIKRIIEIVQIIIRLSRGGALCPGDGEDLTNQNMNQILDEMNKSVGANHIISDTIDGKTVYYIISPEDQANGIIRDNFGGVLGTQNPDGKIAYTRNDPLDITTKEDQPATDPRKNVVIVDSCIKSVYMGDDAKIQKWLTDLKKGL